MKKDQESHSSHTELARSRGQAALSQSLDEEIDRMARMPMGRVVMISEHMNPQVRIPYSGSENAAMHLVSRLFTDAVFNQDVRAIQTIINRIDGGLPKDVDLSSYQTYFGDCINQHLTLTDGERLKVTPDDSVMMALCKSLYDIATEDIYWDPERKVRKKPSDTKKQQRDNAMRMILERAGGRKTMSPVTEATEEIELAGWIKGFMDAPAEGDPAV